MMDLIHLISTFPGIIPSVLIGVLMVFWLLTIVGLLDLESFGPDWLGEAGTDADDTGMPEVLMALGFHRLPFSVVMSAIGLVWWCLCLLGTRYVLSWLPLPMWLSGLIWLVVSLLISAVLAAFLVKPLKPLFRVHAGAKAHDLIGLPCKILTLNVDHQFGQAEVSPDQGAPLNIKVFCPEANSLKKGDWVTILGFDADRSRYRVAAESTDATVAKEAI